MLHYKTRRDLSPDVACCSAGVQSILVRIRAGFKGLMLWL